MLGLHWIVAPFFFLNKKINTNAYGGSGVHVNLAKKVRELVPQVSQVLLQMVDWIAW
jgi:hypothetical protein